MMQRIKISAIDWWLVAAIIALCLMAALWPRARKVKAQAAPVTITAGAGCGNGAVGQFYYCEETASGGTPPYTWTLPALATFEANYPGLAYKITGPNNSILVIYGVPQEPNDGSALLPHPASGVAQTEN